MYQIRIVIIPVLQIWQENLVNMNILEDTLILHDSTPAFMMEATTYFHNGPLKRPQTLKKEVHAYFLDNLDKASSPNVPLKLQMLSEISSMIFCYRQYGHVCFATYKSWIW